MKVINYNGQQIEYHIEYKKIKNLYIQIKDKYFTSLFQSSYNTRYTLNFYLFFI